MFKRAEEKRKRGVNVRRLHDTVIEDIFLLHRNGLLIKHMTLRLKPHVDSDILTGMLRTVQEFVRDSFRGERGELNDLAFGELKISICSGRHVVLAAVIRGERPADITDQMKAVLNELEREHGDALGEWDGHMERVAFVDDYLKKLLEGGYQPGAESGETVGPLLET